MRPRAVGIHLGGMVVTNLKVLGRALRANLGPAVLIWLIGAAIVVAYYSSAAVQAAFAGIAALHERHWVVYPIVSGALFGGILPGISTWVFARKDWPSYRRSFTVILAFWGYRGLEIEVFYRLQAFLWGTSHGLWTVVPKVCTDMFVYNPLVACVWQVLLLRLVARQAGELPAGERLLPRGWYVRYSVPMLIVTWGLWIPAVTFVYLMPLPLQLPLSNLILWLWMLVMLFTNKPPAVREAGTPQPL